jgi:putative ATP-dependent endonuclease of OLD family
MHLLRVCVEGFRSLGSVELELETHTALFGENDAGVSLLLDVLARALSVDDARAAAAFTHDDLACDEQGARRELRVSLLLAPSRAGEWLEDLHAPLRAELLGERPGEEPLRWELAVRPRGARGLAVRESLTSASGRCSEAASLRTWRRTALPVLDLSRGLFAQGTNSGASGERGAREPAAPVRTLREGFARWSASQATLDDERWEEIYPDIERLWSEVQRHLVPLSTTSGWLASDFDLDVPRSAAGARAMPIDSSRGTRLALFLLAGALAQQSRTALHPHSSPLILFGGVEAQLHPTTRFALLGFLLHLRAQVLFSTHSSQVLVHLPLVALRRVVRDGAAVRVFSVQPRAIPRDALRKIRYHLVTRHPEALLARAWLLVEGETEAWLLPEVARARGYFLPIEGVIVIEYAQCGLAPLLRLAESLRIEWHVLSDGDPAGASYAAIARRFARKGSAELRVSELPERDIETSFWRHGFSKVLLRLAGAIERRARESEPAFAHRAIRRALDRQAKPQVALKLIEALGAARAPHVPPPLASCIERVVELARTRPLLLAEAAPSRTRAAGAPKEPRPRRGAGSDGGAASAPQRQPRR